MFKIFNKKSSSPLDAYPVGSYYISSISTSPETLFGGTWERITNRFLWCANDNEIGSTGGERNHTLTVNEMPSHIHAFQGWHYALQSGNTSNNQSLSCKYISDDAYDSDTSLRPAGGSQAHNNMPPYIGVYCWHRTA